MWTFSILPGSVFDDFIAFSGRCNTKECIAMWTAVVFELEIFEILVDGSGDTTF